MGLGKGHRHDLSGPPCVVTENVEDYRRAIGVYLNADDVVLELGCAQGVTTGLIGDVVREVIGVDKSEGQTMRAIARNPKVQFANIDAFDARSILKLGRKFTAIFIDVSGNRPVGDVVQLIDRYDAVFQPRLFVVKCYKLKRLMGMCRVFPEDCEAPPNSSQAGFSGREHVKVAMAPVAGVTWVPASNGNGRVHSVGPMSHDLMCGEEDGEEGGEEEGGEEEEGEEGRGGDAGCVGVGADADESRDA